MGVDLLNGLDGTRLLLWTSALLFCVAIGIVFLKNYSFSKLRSALFWFSVSIILVWLFLVTRTTEVLDVEAQQLSWVSIDKMVLNLSFITEPVSLVFAFSGLIAVLFCGFRERSKEVLSSLILAMVATLMAWTAKTGWSNIFSIVLSFVSLVVFESGNWKDQKIYIGVSQFLAQRLFGAFLIFLGLVALSGAGIYLQWTHPQNVTNGFLSFVGTILVIIGISTQMNPFFSIKLKTTQKPLTRFIVELFFPTICGFAILFQLEQSLGTSLPSSSLQLTLGVFGILIGVFGLIESEVFSLVLCSFSGISFFYGFGIVQHHPFISTIGLVLHGFAVLGLLKTDEHSRGIVEKLLAVLPAVGIFGQFTLLSSGGIFSDLSASPFGVGLALVSFILSQLHLFRAAFASQKHIKLQKRLQPTPIALYDRFWLVVLTLSGFTIFWTGQFLSLASLVPGEPTFFAPITDRISQNSIPLLEWPIAAVLVGSNLAVLLSAYWVCVGKNGDRISHALKSAPSFYQFIANGFYVSFAFSKTIQLLKAIVFKIDNGISTHLFESAVPKALAFANKKNDHYSPTLDSYGGNKLEHGFRKVFQVPAKVIQLYQNGSVQWYIALVLLVGAAIWAHVYRILGDL